MNLIYNINYDIASFICLIIIMIYLNAQHVQMNVSSRVFRMLVACSLVLCASDIASAITLSYVDRLPAWVNYLTNSIYFFFEGMTLLSFVYYIRKSLKEMDERIPVWMMILDDFPLIVCGILIVVNLFTGCIFTIEETGYHAGPVHFVTYVAPAFYFIRGITLMLQYKNRFRKAERIIVYTFISAATVTVGLQTFIFHNVLLCCLGATIATLMLLITLETPEFQKLAEAKKALEISKQEAEQADYAKSMFLMNMSHEIRTPINGVLGMNALILKKKDCGEDVRECAVNIQNSSKTLLTIIDDILDVSKISTGEFALECAEYDLSEVVNEAYQSVATRAKDKKLALKLSVEPSLPIKLYGDGTRVRQIMVNLLTNAVKYTEKGGIHWHISWNIGENDRITLKISVEDTGIGISKENQEKLFHAFERFDTSRNRNIEGTGLGLRITKQLVDLMAGLIRVESEYGKGSTFLVELPQTVCEWEAIGLYKPHSVDEYHETGIAFHAPTANILVVDDVPINLRVIGGLLRNTGIRIDTAVSGLETLERATAKHYDIIFLDHMMPGMDGMETLERLKTLEGNLNTNTPIVMLTANAVVGAREEYLLAGFRDYLTKPVKEIELYEILLEYLPADKVTRV